MGSIVRPILKVASIAVMFMPQFGWIARLAITVGLSVLDRALAPKSAGVSNAMQKRLFAQLNPTEKRKMVLGITAAPADLRYEEWSGTNQEYNDRIIVVAAHRITSFEEIWFADRLAWTAAGGVQAPFTGYLEINTRTEGNPGNTIAINGGAKWGASRRLTGCAYFHMRCKTTGNSKKAESPFASGIPDRLTIKVKGMPLYDPRLDSSVGGSGPCRANDCSTWVWSNDTAGQNPILHAISYQLGWRINGIVSVGQGQPAKRIDLASGIPSANLCEEPVALAAGGSEPRYRSAQVISDEENPLSALTAIMQTCAGTVRDVNGRFSYHVRYNDLAMPVAAFTDDDVIGGYEWAPVLELDQDPNVVRGRFTDASTHALFQMVDYPAVSIPSPDGLDRVKPFDLPGVQSPSQAQRLAKMELQRGQYAGTFGATFKMTGLRAAVGQPVTLTFSPRGWVNKLFRVQQQLIRMNGTVDLVLREEHPSIYSWMMEETAAVQPITPTPYDPINSPLVQGIAAADQPPSIRPTATPPMDAPDGQLFIDAENRQYRAEGAVLTWGDEPWTWGDEPWTTSPWVEVQDQAIGAARRRADLAVVDAAQAQASADAAQADVDALAEAVAAIDDDGIITPSEKTETLIPQAAALAALWTATSALAATANITASSAYTSAATRRMEWLDFLASISPAWNNASVASPVVRGTLDTRRDNYDAALKALQRAATEAMTAAQTPDINGNFVFDLSFDSTGTAITTPLPFERRFRGMLGTTDRSSDTAFTLLNVSPALSLTINNTPGSADRGALTVGVGTTGGGTATLRAVLPGGGTVERVLNFRKTNAAPPSTGGGTGASTFAQDTTFNTITGSAFTQISDELRVTSDSAGNVRVAIDLGYSAVTGDEERIAAFKAAYSATSGGSLTDMFSEEAGSACNGGFEPQPGFYTRAEATFAMPAANTDYFFKLLGRRWAGSGNIAFTGNAFTVRQ